MSEVLFLFCHQGDEAFQCEVCSERTSATKRLRLYRLPKVLLLHIKRFKYSSNAREKILTNVTFPLKVLHCLSRPLQCKPQHWQVVLQCCSLSA